MWILIYDTHVKVIDHLAIILTLTEALLVVFVRYPGLAHSVVEAVQRLGLVTRLSDALFQDGNEEAQFVYERDVVLGVNEPIVSVLAEFEKLSILVFMAVSTHFVHHEVFLILELAEDHGE